MKLVALAPDGRAALVVRSHVIELPAAQRIENSSVRGTPRDVLADDDLLDAVRRLDERLHTSDEATLARLGSSPVADARLLAPVFPRTIICAGNNYRAHSAEMNTPLPSRPGGFLKSASAVTGPGEPIVLPPDPAVAATVDYEGELCVVIGKPAYRVSERDALSYVAGYTCGNDVSARNDVAAMFAWLREPAGTSLEAFSNPQDVVLLGKQYPTFMPLGPCIVTADEIPDPHDLRITTRVDGEMRQNESTSELVFGIAEMLAYWSRFYAFAPGDVISTGSPSGVALSFKPPKFLKPGSRVDVEIAGIGVLSNPVVATGEAER